MAFWIFQNVVITAALAAAVALVCRSGRIGPVARHALWVLVLVKFVTPPLVVWPWAAPDPFGIAAIDSPTAARFVTVGSDAEIAQDLSLVRLETTDGPGLAAPSSAPENRTGRRDQTLLRAGALAWPWLLAAWAAGCLGLLGIEGARVARLARRIRASRLATRPDDAIDRRVAELSARLGLRPVPVVMMAGASSPAVWGLGRPVLLWPASLPADSTDACIDGLLVHELAHVKRGDHLVGWIELAAGIVWWWNPLFWFVRSALREQAELACDAWVISALPNGRRAYAESLLALSGALSHDASSSPSMAAVGIRATSRRVLERRLVMIMKGRAPLRLPFAGLFCLALVGAATLPAWATSAQQTPPPSPPATPVVVSPASSVPVPTEPQTPPPTLRARPARGPATVPVVMPQTPPPGSAPRAARPSVPVVMMQTPPPPTPKTAPAQAAKPAPMDFERKVARPEMIYISKPANMPAEGLALLDSYEKDREAIQKEIDQKLAVRREAAVAALQALQDQYTKAGKLDEAVAIRDYLRAGGPGNGKRITFGTIKR